MFLNAGLRPVFALLLLFAALLAAHAQNLSASDQALMGRYEDSLFVIADSMYITPIPDDRAGYAEAFARQLVRALRTPGSYSYPFKKLERYINILEPEDKSWRMFNWVIAPSEITRRYYGAVQMPGQDLKLFGLSDVSMKVTKGLEDSVFTGGRWMGALYYRVIPVVKDGQTWYTLFGLNSSLTSSNRKVLDAMRITPQGVEFGANIFGVGSENIQGQAVKRFILEYSKNVQVTMNWDADINAIVHDELISASNDPARKYTYVPTGETAGFRWDASIGQWVHFRNAVPVRILRDGAPPSVDNPLGGQ